MRTLLCTDQSIVMQENTIDSHPVVILIEAFAVTFGEVTRFNPAMCTGCDTKVLQYRHACTTYWCQSTAGSKPQLLYDYQFSFYSSRTTAIFYRPICKSL